jgi:hypothetical protein
MASFARLYGTESSRQRNAGTRPVKLQPGLIDSGMALMEFAVQSPKCREPGLLME